MIDFNEMMRRADREYREAEALAKEGKPLPYLVTLSFATKEEAHAYIESIKKHGGVILDHEYVTPIDAELITAPASVMDFRPWGGSTEPDSTG